MFPWVYGFEWNAGTVIFLGVFFGVVIVILTTVTTAVIRSRRALKTGASHEIRWEADFEDLPTGARACRHEIDGTFECRTCVRGFDCRECETHARIVREQAAGGADGKRWASDAGKPGFATTTERWYHRGHAWVQPEADGTVTVGLDDFASRLLGASAQPDLPPVGRFVHVNGTGWRFRRDGAKVRVLSPVSGEVVARGSRAEGWYLRIRPEGGTLDTRHLLRGSAEVRPWLDRELSRLQNLLGAGGMGVRIVDGGGLVDDVTKYCRGVDWDVVCGEMLLEP